MNFLFLKTQSYWRHYIELSACILFLNEDVPVKKAKITTEGDFSQPSSKHHTFAEVVLVSLIINVMWEGRQDFEINKPAKG